MSGMAGCNKPRSHTAHSLMMHAVYVQNRTSCNSGEKGTGGDIHFVRRNVVVKRLRVCNREIFRELAGDILVDVAAESDVD